MEICPKCGLPLETCICSELAKARQRLSVTALPTKYGKFVTVISGFDPKAVDLKAIAKTLKREFACGGTIREDKIELQGEHTKKAREKLIELGFTVE